MSDDGGPDERAKLRERFAVAIAGGPYALADKPFPTAAVGLRQAWILNEAQALTDESMKRRKQDNTKRLAEGAEAMRDEPLYADNGEVSNG